MATCDDFKPHPTGTPKWCEFDKDHEGDHGTKSGWRWRRTEDDLTNLAISESLKDAIRAARQD